MRVPSKRTQPMRWFMIAALCLLIAAVTSSAKSHERVDQLVQQSVLCQLGGDRAGALAAMEAAYALQPLHAGVVLRLARALEADQQVARALTIVTQALEQERPAEPSAKEAKLYADLEALKTNLAQKVLLAQPSATSKTSRDAPMSATGWQAASAADLLGNRTTLETESWAHVWATPVLRDSGNMALHHALVLLAEGATAPFAAPHARGGKARRIRLLVSPASGELVFPTPNAARIEAGKVLLTALRRNVHLLDRSFASRHHNSAAAVLLSTPESAFQFDTSFDANAGIRSPCLNIRQLDIRLHEDAVGHAQASHIVPRSHLTLLAGLQQTLEGDSSSMQVFLTDPRPGAGPIHLPGWDDTNVPSAFRLEPGAFLIFPSFVRHHMLAHHQQDASARRVFVEIGIELEAQRCPDFIPADDRLSTGAVTLQYLWGTPMYSSSIVPLLNQLGPSQHPLLESLTATIRQLANSTPSVRKSNKGGWQSSAKLFDSFAANSAVQALRRLVYAGAYRWLQAQASQGMLFPEFTQTSNAHEWVEMPALLVDGKDPRISHPTLCGDVHIEVVHSWAGINKAGDSNSPHIHPGALLSGVFYVATPTAPPTYVEFIDPRSGASMLPDIDQTQIPVDFSPEAALAEAAAKVVSVSSQQTSDALSPPPPTARGGFASSRVFGAGATHAAASLPGRLILFPAWLEHFVAPFGGSLQDEDRIIVSFNVLVHHTVQECTQAGLLLHLPKHHLAEQV
ncbi:hypothetical protein CAOG_06695 [Capsaspora owczarzaki ATCC 30864]|uniref:Uncharacterized protein n=1 Tax=Capsaspora owczarzaki (strain ATCC 30864) TaxID=595528 RepID=A0A0D2VXH0_CAPO3|nr:hypothetical protein CAOG_06695 [Capsaspora owczarzaki ATCC 30864]KJE96357.1 hypothetical protein CAOG_006695 [Capsaspora owczarzaki ATCC 30864]|eukprot:XP_004344316.1 hypothetical protein CAOG_06695 [Capsaspora owczarzaki ATCC 30864]